MEITIIVIALLLGLFLLNINNLQVGYGQTGLPPKQQQQEPSVNQSNSSNATSPIPKSPLSPAF